jgi:hypothetical protein
VRVYRTNKFYPNPYRNIIITNQYKRKGKN